MTTTAIDLKDVSVSYGQIAAVRNVSLSIHQGELVVLIGSNGAGKTTLLRAISGLNRSTGEIAFMGRSVRGTAPEKLVRSGLCHVPEGRHIFARMTVLENLQVATWGSGISLDQAADKIFAMFPRLKERSSQVAGTLSGGEQQMLALARSLVREPKVILLDEPSMGLAPIIVGQIFDMIQEIHASGTTVLLVEQNATRALGIADRAYVMETGELSGGGRAAELLESIDLKAVYFGKSHD